MCLLIPYGSSEIPDKWANMFQCNASRELFTCARDDVSAVTACRPERALGTYTYVSANMTVAQNGKEVVNTTTSTNVSSSETVTMTSIATGSSSTCPTTISYNKTQLIAIGAGLGAGLGIPLLIAASLAVYYGGWKRRKLEQEQLQAQQEDLAVPTIFTGFNHKESPEEVPGSIPQYEVMGSLRHGHSELPGST